MLVLVSVSCAQPDSKTSRMQDLATQPAPIDASSKEKWLGIYASPIEIGGFARTTLVLVDGLRDEISYQMRFHSDVRLADDIALEELHGRCLIDGDVLYVPQVFGYTTNGQPRVIAEVTRFTLLEINGHKTLMRDDALRAFRIENKLYDYGILIKVSGTMNRPPDLRNVQHPSIKLLHSDPNKPWSDPFVK